jgi:LPPG:FO 2-phospho-L-lactate transferase
LKVDPQPPAMTTVNSREGTFKITALAGGVGASKLLIGLAAVMPSENITVIANTGDDIELLGLRICPDLDTITYTLGGVINETTGWGIRDDSFHWLESIARYRGPSWFRLGDRDLATHVYRTEQLRQGCSLTEVTNDIRRSFGVAANILPMTDSYVPTRVDTDEGEMHFQEYFVRRRCEPRVRGLRFEGIEESRPSPGVLEAIRDADAVVICPSNPFISIGPILAVPGIREALISTNAHVVAVTPIIAGRALKGPAADMLRELGHEVSAAAVATMYRDFCDAFVLDREDAASASQIETLGMEVVVTNTIMRSAEDKQRLAQAIVDYLWH